MISCSKKTFTGWSK